MSRIIATLSVLLLLPSLGCTSPFAEGVVPASAEVVASSRRYQKVYVIGTGDVLDVVVRLNPNLTRTCLVRPDGYITLPLLDDVKAAGLSFPELDAVLTEGLSAHLNEPDVSVIGTDVRDDVVFVVGEVALPGAVPLREARNAAQAIAHTGGFTERALEDAVGVIRLVKDHIAAIPIAMGTEGQPGGFMHLQTFRLEPDDIVFVPETGAAEFDTWARQYVSQPLQPINTLLSVYTNYKLIEVFDQSLQ